MKLILFILAMSAAAILGLVSTRMNVQNVFYSSQPYGLEY